MATEEGYVTVFLRVPKGVKEVLEETVKGMNEARQIGERVHSVNEVVTRCVVDVLAPAFDKAGRDLATALRGMKRERDKGPAVRARDTRVAKRKARKALPSGRKPRHSVKAEVMHGGR